MDTRTTLNGLLANIRGQEVEEQTQEDRLMWSYGLTNTLRNQIEEAIKQGYDAPEEIPGQSAELWYITPETAEVLLEHMIKNRKKRKNKIKNYSEHMKEGRFFLTNQAIGINTRGEIMDGQHRLSAIVESGVPQLMWVISGIHEDAHLVIDRNTIRTLADSHYMQNEQDAYSAWIAAIAKLTWKVEHAWQSGLAVSTASRLTEDDIILNPYKDRMLDRVPGDELVNVARGLFEPTAGGPGIPPSVGGSFYYLAVTNDLGEEADEFIAQLRGYQARLPQSAAGRLVARLQENIKQKGSENKWSQMTHMVFLLQAFERFIDARGTGQEHKVPQLKKTGKLADLRPPKARRNAVAD